MIVGAVNCDRVFLDNPVRRAISRTDNRSRMCIRLILANIPTLITPGFPCLKIKQGSELCGSVLGARQRQVGIEAFVNGLMA